MIQLDLDGKWLICDAEPTDGDEPANAGYDDSNWTIAAVPGNIYAALLEARRIKDPYFGHNDKESRWVDERTWWYRRSFRAPTSDNGDRCYLTFDGLDAFATVFLNGVKLGEHNNMFTPAEFDCTELLRPDSDNVIAVRIDPAALRVKDKDVSRTWAAFDEYRVWARKAQMSFGWDWAPRLIAAGIWRSVRLTTCHKGRLLDVLPQTHRATSKEARLSIEITVDVLDPSVPLQVEARMDLDGGPRYQRLPVVEGRATFKYVIHDPKLWWTHDLGDPHLYKLDLRLLHADEELDTRSVPIGVRMIELLQEPDPDGRGKSFNFLLNGVKLFCKGANWVPPDCMIGTVTPDRYREMINRARTANMNMLRVWGGGVYEDRAFYQACNEAGILVWQDFMFACAAYPEWDKSFISNIIAEATAAVIRLRRHPCIAIWCGCNENQWLHQMFNWNKKTMPAYGEQIYSRILPAICSQNDPSRPYWPGSPFGGDDHNSALEGNRHNWQVWAGAPLDRHFRDRPANDETPENVSFRNYSKDNGRFLTEFGIQASPVLSTLKRSIPEDSLQYDSKQLLYRNKDVDDKRKDRMMQAHTGLPKDLAEYEQFSMFIQAEGLAYAIEHFRRRKINCGGTLLWQFNDAWPGISWSILDYFLVPKAAYYYVMRAFRPVILSLRKHDGNVEIWGVNDTLIDCCDTLKLTKGTFLDGAKTTHELSITIPSNTSKLLHSFPVSALPGDNPASSFVWAESLTDAQIRTHLHFAEIKDIQLPQANITTQVTPADDENAPAGCVDITFTADEYACFVHLAEPLPGRLSDNFFDLLPRQPRTVKLFLPEDTNLEDLDLSVKTLNDIRAQ